MVRILVVLVLILAALILFPIRVPVPTSSFMLQWQWQHRGDERSIEYEWVAMADISEDFLMGVIAAEDQNFPEHHGVDIGAIKKAIEDRVEKGRLRGGSTITQQMVKNLYLWPDQSYLRKALEAAISLLVDGIWPKKRILEVYANIVELGDGIYGIKAAARRYFKGEPGTLSRRQSYTLAAMLPSPRRSNPLDPSAAHLKRISHIETQVRQLGGNNFLRGVLEPE